MRCGIRTFAVRPEMRAHPIGRGGQGFVLPVQLIDQGRVVRFDNFVEQRLLGSVSLIVGVANGILAITAC